MGMVSEVCMGLVLDSCGFKKEPIESNVLYGSIYSIFGTPLPCERALTDLGINVSGEGIY